MALALSRIALSRSLDPKGILALPDRAQDHIRRSRPTGRIVSRPSLELSGMPHGLRSSSFCGRDDFPDIFGVSWPVISMFFGLAVFG